jgi:hypothetical protein
MRVYYIFAIIAILLLCGVQLYTMGFPEESLCLFILYTFPIIVMAFNLRDKVL